MHTVATAAATATTTAATAATPLATAAGLLVCCGERHMATGLRPYRAP